jgi:hypothetical protein
MRMRVLAIVCLFVVACAEDVHIRFPGAPPPDVPVTTGTLVLLLGQPASDVAVAIDGWLVFDGRHTSRIVIDGIPIGTREVTLAANSGDKTFKIWIDSDHATTVPIGVPDETYGFLKTIVASVITVVVYALLHP